MAETAPRFIETHRPAPIGFVSFDLDLYTSTAQALTLFEGDREHLLPRVFCYFDDTMSNDTTVHTWFTGALRAIDEFNEKHADRKIGQIRGLAATRFFPMPWNEGMFAFQDFGHRLFCRYLYGENCQMPLASPGSFGD